MTTELALTALKSLSWRYHPAEDLHQVFKENQHAFTTVLHQRFIGSCRDGGGGCGTRRRIDSPTNLMQARRPLPPRAEPPRLGQPTDRVTRRWMWCASSEMLQCPQWRYRHERGPK